MHHHDLSGWTHDHVFGSASDAAERSTWRVVWITAVMMVVEIAAGWWFNSMALLADGWHMSSHALAIGLSALAYAAARRHARDPRFAFGTWKVEVLGGFASAVLLLGVAAVMVIGSVERIVSPSPIHYQEAIFVAVLGLAVNVVCALVLGSAHHHDGAAAAHGHAHGHAHAHPHAHDHGRRTLLHAPDHAATHEHAHPHGRAPNQDLNLRSAYLHVIADAATSVLAILALAGGLLYGWSWLDPVMGIVGAVLVAVWARGLIRDTGNALLDREMDHPVVEEIRAVVESDEWPGETRLTDLHVWRVGRNAYSCALSVLTHDTGLSADVLRRRLAVHEEIAHSTIEIHFCPDAAHGEPAKASPAP
jgi:cation diffusion facilitator family transporter